MTPSYNYLISTSDVHWQVHQIYIRCTGFFFLVGVWLFCCYDCLCDVNANKQENTSTILYLLCICKCAAFEATKSHKNEKLCLPLLHSYTIWCTATCDTFDAIYTVYSNFGYVRTTIVVCSEWQWRDRCVKTLARLKALGYANRTAFVSKCWMRVHSEGIKVPSWDRFLALKRIQVL